MSIVAVTGGLILLLAVSWFMASRRDSAVMAPPGWYVDPAGSGRRRWFDGRTWTQEYRDDPAGAKRAA